MVAGFPFHKHRQLRRRLPVASRSLQRLSDPTAPLRLVIVERFRCLLADIAVPIAQL
jgi:hypothetical protein